MKQAYFLTVDWCNKDRRGIFCDAEGHCFRKDDEPHTALETQKILGPFWIILAPESELFSVEQVGEFIFWQPLAEYSDQFGIALRQRDVPIAIAQSAKPQSV